MEKREVLKQLTEFYAAQRSGTTPAKLDNKKLWQVLVDVTMNEIKTLGVYFDAYAAYVESCPEFRETECEVVNQLFEKARNKGNALNERKNAVIPLIILAPFMPIKRTVTAIETAIDICSLLIAETGNIPTDFIDNFDDLMCDVIEPDNLKDLVDAYKAAIADPERKVAAIACIAPIAEDICDFVDESFFFVLDTMKEALAAKDNEAHNQSGLLLLEIMASLIASAEPQDVPKPQELIDLLTPLLKSDNANTGKAVYRAYKELIRTEYIDEEHAPTVLKLVSNFTSESTIKYFFKILSTLASPDSDCDCGCYLEDECCCEHSREPNLTVIQLLIDFCVDNLKGDTTPLIKGHSLDLLADLALLDSMYIEDCYVTALGAAIELVKTEKYEAYPWLSSFLVILCKIFPDQTKDQIKEILPKMLVAYRENHVSGVKNRINLLSDISHIVGKGVNDEILHETIEASKGLINSKDQKEFFGGCDSIISLRPKLSLEQANEITKLIVEKSNEITDSEMIDDLLHVIKKILKKFSIDNAIINPFVEKMLKGELSVQNGVTPINEQPVNECYFEFIEMYIRKYPGKAPAVCNTLINWLKESKISGIAAILSPISVGIETAAIKEDGAAIIVGCIKELMDKLLITDSNELIEAAKCLTSINQAFQNVINPDVKFFLDKIHSIVQIITDSSAEEEEMMIEVATAMPEFSRFVFNVYATNASIEVNEELLLSFVRMIPFPPEVEFVGELLGYIVDMLVDEERFECIVVPALKAFTELLLMKKSDIEKYDLDQDTLKDMKETLRTIVKKKPAVGKQIIKDFQSSRVKVNRFNALVR
jgi:hypothetical protein